MRSVHSRRDRDHDVWSTAHALAQQAFARASGAPLIEGNEVRLLEDAAENYPAWLDAIRAAEHHVHFESYIVQEDDAGRTFADALVTKAKEGVRVRVVYDWMGGLGKTSRSFWNRLRAGGVEVRCYNPPRWDSPWGWISRDHRKTISVDGDVAFVSGLCVGRMWLGDPERSVAPWRDTGIAVRGPAVEHVERAFAEIWAALGEPIPEREPGTRRSPARRGDTALRVIATAPATASLLRVNELVAALATHHLWLTDAYFAGTTAYVQALRAAARDGVDVRLLVPGATDVPLLKPLSRAGYRPLLEAGVRVFEWNGPMLHAKTAVADSKWARVGSTNLNVASWFGNYEMDVVVEDTRFARLMERSYLRDLENATEIVLRSRHLVTVARPPDHRPARSAGVGSASRAAAGAVRIGNAVGAAIANRRVLESVEARLTLAAGAAALAVASLAVFFPRVFAYPLAAAFAWSAGALLYRGFVLHRLGSREEEEGRDRRAGGR